MNRYTVYVFGRRPETQQTLWADTGFAARKALAAMHGVPITDCVSIRDTGGLLPIAPARRG